MKTVTVDMVKKVVAAKYGVKIADFNSKERVEAAARPRKIAIYLACDLCDLSHSQLGKTFNQTFIAVGFANKIIKRDMRGDPYFAEEIEGLTAEIKEAKSSLNNCSGNSEEPGQSKFHVQKKGPREVILADCEGGIEDTTYYYNIIDNDGGMSEEVTITRHKSLAGAIKEAKRLALDRDWVGPGAFRSFPSIPPRIVRTVKFVEMHRVLVKGPIPPNGFLDYDYPKEVFDGEGNFDYIKTHKKVRADITRCIEQKHIWDVPIEDEGKPHPGIGKLPLRKV